MENKVNKKDIEVIEKEDGSYFIQTPFEIEEIVQSLRHIRIYPKEEILDDVEKEYLRNVIKPFRNKVKCIAKISYDYKEYIVIDLVEDSIYLPHFKKNTMYKCMETNKRYTLEELGL